MIPDCYDPVRQEEDRQRAWDETLARCPVCALCGRIIRPGEVVHHTDRATVCAECVDELVENEGIVEVC
jgi:hypothetical protein